MRIIVRVVLETLTTFSKNWLATFLSHSFFRPGLELTDLQQMTLHFFERMLCGVFTAGNQMSSKVLAKLHTEF